MCNLDCWHAAFSLEISLVLISAGAIANHDVTLQGIGTTREKTFFSGLAYALVYRGSHALVSRAVII